MFLSFIPFRSIHAFHDVIVNVLFRLRLGWGGTRAKSDIVSVLSFSDAWKMLKYSDTQNEMVYERLFSE